MPNGLVQRRPPKTVPQNQVNYVLNDWPRHSRRVAEQIIKFYGLPAEITMSMMLWKDLRPWRRMIVHREGVPHNFPRPHLDILEQTVDYRVPANKHDELAEFDGSIVIDRTRGEMSVRCNSEETNKLILNLAHDIVMGRLLPDQARQRYARAVRTMRMNWPEPYTKNLQFDTGMTLMDRENFTADPDHRSRSS